MSNAAEDNLPRPVGYHLMVAVPQVEETFNEGVIVKADTTKRNESILTMVGRVIDMGPDAYKDTKRYPSGPWCQIGDYVMFRTHSGTRFIVGQQEFRMLNDDSIEAVVPDPRAIQRA